MVNVVTYCVLIQRSFDVHRLLRLVVVAAMEAKETKYSVLSKIILRHFPRQGLSIQQAVRRNVGGLDDD